MKIQMPKVSVAAGLPDRDAAQHLLVLVQKGSRPEKVFAHALRDQVLRRAARSGRKAGKPAPLSATQQGQLVVWAEWDPAASIFDQQTGVRKALELINGESPSDLDLVIHAEPSTAPACAALAVQVILMNSQYQLGKTTNQAASINASLKRLRVFGVAKSFSPARAIAVAEGNLLARALTLRPPNDLTPKRFRADIGKLAKQNGWQLKEFSFKSLSKLGAGAFCAVAQGSPQQDAAIVRLSYRPAAAAKGRAPVALVGKGICMDTGGHGLKSAKGMYGMHEDMAGSAVVLGILKAASDLRLPVPIDAWLAIAQNHIGPGAYQPGDVVAALDGTTIEVVHTDAEGRMVLADTLTLATRAKPSCVLDFATLTGAMVHALDSRMAGVFANSSALAGMAVAAGSASGERVVLFPLDADYDEALESKVADVKQCLIGGEGDAIYAARFLSRFVNAVPWVHMDLSAYRHTGGLAAVANDLNGFGVGWGLAMLENPHLG